MEWKKMLGLDGNRTARRIEALEQFAAAQAEYNHANRKAHLQTALIQKAANRSLTLLLLAVAVAAVFVWYNGRNRF